jgi:uncharacterized membrane protein required for colicin V production
MVIDIIFMIFAGYGFYLGFSKGIIKTLFTVLSFVFGIIAAFKFAPAATNFLETAFNNENPLMFLAGFLMAFVITMIVIRTLAKGIEGVLKTANINIINQIAGGILLAGLMILLYSMLLWFGDQATLIDNEAKDQSFTYDYIEHFPGKVWTTLEYLQPTFKEFWEESVDFMDRLQEKSMEQTEGEVNIFDFDDVPESEEPNPTSNR